MLKHLDKIDLQLPNTLRQFDLTLNGLSNTHTDGVKYSKASCRKAAAVNFIGRFILIPLDIPARFIVNCSHLIVAPAITIIVEIGARIIFRQFLHGWTAIGRLILDLTLATALSPFQAPAKATRLFLGILAPSTLYKDPAQLLTRKQLNLFFWEIPTYRKIISSHFFNEICGSVEKQAAIIFLGALLNFTRKRMDSFDGSYAHQMLLTGLLYPLKLLIPEFRGRSAKEIKKLKEEYATFQILKDTVITWSQDSSKISFDSLKKTFQKLPKAMRKKCSKDLIKSNYFLSNSLYKPTDLIKDPQQLKLVKSKIKEEKKKF